LSFLKSNKYSSIFITVSLILIFSVTGICKDITVEAYTDKTIISDQGIINFTIEVKGTQDIPDIAWPRHADFIVVSGPSHSSNFQVINGKMSASKKITWHIAPTKTGNLKIPAFTITHKRKNYTTKPITITVRKDNKTNTRTSPNNRRQQQQVSAGQPALFFKSNPSKTTVYIGEEINVTFELFFQNVKTFNRVKIPDAKGFWLEEFPSRNQPTVSDVIIDGVRYNKAVIQRIAFFPTTTGELTIDPMVINCEVPDTKQRRRSMFDDFFNDPFFSNTKTIRLLSEPIKINVKALPEKGKPAGFSGMIGDFSVKSTLDTLEIDQNEAVTLKYVITGRGNINSIKIPPLKLPESVEIFDPKVDRITNNRGNWITGTVSYEYILIPRAAGVLKIPALDLPFFDSFRNRYRHIYTKSFNIKVNPREREFTTLSTGLTKKEIALLGKDIRFISRTNDKWHKIDKSIFTTGWFVFLNIFSIILIAASFGFSKWSQEMETNILFARKKKALGIANKRLKNAEKALEQNSTEEYLHLLNQAVVKYISDRLGLPPSGIGIPEITEELTVNKIDGKLIKKIEETVGGMEMARFSPNSVSNEDDKNLCNVCRELISDLSKVI